MFYKKITSVIVGCLISIGVHAGDLAFDSYISNKTLPWDAFKGPTVANAIYKKDEDNIVEQDMSILVSVEIDHAINGDKKIYFSIIKSEESYKEKAPCSKDDKVYNSVMKFNNQAIKVYQFCDELTGRGDSYITLTPITSNGLRFIVNEFKNSPDAVSFEYRDLKLNVSAVGFTKAWNSFGENAL